MWRIGTTGVNEGSMVHLLVFLEQFITCNHNLNHINWVALPNNNPLTQDRQWQRGGLIFFKPKQELHPPSPVTFIHSHGSKTRTRAAVTHASWSRTWPYGICSEERGRKAGTDLTQDYTFNPITLESNLSRWRDHLGDLRPFQFPFTAICVHMSLVTPLAWSQQDEACWNLGKHTEGLLQATSFECGYNPPLSYWGPLSSTSLSEQMSNLCLTDNAVGHSQRDIWPKEQHAETSNVWHTVLWLKCMLRGFVGLETLKVGQDVCLFHHCPFCKHCAY